MSSTPKSNDNPPAIEPGPPKLGFFKRFFRALIALNVLDAVSEKEQRDYLHWSLYTILGATVAVYSPLGLLFLQGKPIDLLSVIKGGELILLAIGLMIPALQSIVTSTTIYPLRKSGLFLSFFIPAFFAWNLIFMRFSSDLIVQAPAITPTTLLTKPATQTPVELIWGGEPVRIILVTILVVLWSLRFSFIGRVLELREYGKEAKTDPEKIAKDRTDKIEGQYDART